jgi:hypothetical protein
VPSPHDASSLHDASSSQAAYNELCGYTLTHFGPAFIHQHVVDAFAAQSASEQTKPITLTFALVGLYLHVEKNYSGKQVQRVHMQLARRKREWPSFALPPPQDRGGMTAADVIAAPAGPDRDAAIDAWCASVWEAFRDSHRAVADLLRQYEIV